MIHEKGEQTPDNKCADSKPRMDSRLEDDPSLRNEWNQYDPSQMQRLDPRIRLVRKMDRGKYAARKAKK